MTRHLQKAIVTINGDHNGENPIPHKHACINTDFGQHENPTHMHQKKQTQLLQQQL